MKTDNLDIPEKDEMLFEDKSVGLKEYEDFITING